MVDGARLRHHARRVAAVVALGVADAVHLARTSPRGTTICRIAPTATPARSTKPDQDQHLVRAAARGADHPPEGDARRRRRHAVRQHADPLVQRAGEGQHARPRWARPTCWPAARAARCAPAASCDYDGQGLPHNNLLVSILNAMGVPDDQLRQARLVHGTADRTDLRHNRSDTCDARSRCLRSRPSRWWLPMAGTSGCGSDAARHRTAAAAAAGGGGGGGGGAGGGATVQLRRHLRPIDPTALIDDMETPDYMTVLRGRPQRRLVGGRRRRSRRAPPSRPTATPPPRRSRAAAAAANTRCTSPATASRSGRC